MEVAVKSDIRVTTPSSQPAPAMPSLTVERLRTIVQDSHLSFLIGAGASSPYFKPLGPIETVLTELTSRDDASRLARASLRGYFFEHVLLPNAGLIEQAPASKAVIDSYVQFLRTLNRILLRRRNSLIGKQANIFTTNVDMAIEVALESLEIDCNDGFIGKIRPRLDLGEFGTLRYRQGTRYEYRSEIPVLNLFKLHGSAAWRQIEEEIYFDHRLESIRALAKTYANAKSDLVPITRIEQINTEKLLARCGGKNLSDGVTAFEEAYASLSIVNPEKTKFESTVLNKTYYELLRRFANELEKENSALLVHGFSFRDEHLRDLVLRAAATNPTLQTIVFCYDAASRVEIAALLPKERVKNGNILLISPEPPEADADARALTLRVVVEDYLAPILTDSTPPAEHIVDVRISAQDEAGRDA